MNTQSYTRESRERFFISLTFCSHISMPNYKCFVATRSSWGWIAFACIDLAEAEETVLHLNVLDVVRV